MDQNILNYYFLKFKNNTIEEEYKVKKDNNMEKCNIALNCITITTGIINSLLLSLYEDKNKSKSESMRVVIITSYILCGINILGFISTFIFCRPIIRRIVNIMNYVLSAYYLSFFRFFYILYLNDYLFYVYLIMFFVDYMKNIIWYVTSTLDFLDSLIINVSLIAAMPIYYVSFLPFAIIQESYVSFLIMIVLCTMISYLFVYQNKKAFYFYRCLDVKSKSYQDILENMNNGVVYVNNNKISYINKALVEKLMKNKRILQIFEMKKCENKPQNILETENVIMKDPSSGIDTIPLNEQMWKIIEHSDNVLEMIFTELVSDSKINLTQHYNNVRTVDLVDNKQDVIIFKNLGYLEKIKNYYTSNFEKNEFFTLGNVNFDIGNVNNNDDNILTFEIHCRYIREDNKSDNFQFIFNDVTKIKCNEEKNIEFKYKCMVLSKIAHEFKNPLICMNELLDQLNDSLKIRDKSLVFSVGETINLRSKSSSNSKTSLHHSKHFSHIKSLINYLLILVKDFDFFSNNLSSNSTNVDIGEVDIDELLKFCKEIAHGLLKKNGTYNNVQITVKRDENLPKIIHTDEMKLKQILVNLVSNSVKFTQKGLIKINAKIEANLIKFVVTDTGIGIKESEKTLLQNLKKQMKEGARFCLGLSIIYDLTNKLGSEIEFKSEQGRGTKFWFYLPLKSEDNLNNAFKKQSKFRPNNNLLTDPQKISSSNIIFEGDFFIDNIEINNSNSDDELSRTIELDNIKLSHPHSKDTSARYNLKLTNNNICFKNNIIINESGVSSSHDSSMVKNNIPTYNNDCHNIIVVDDEVFTRQSNIRIITSCAKEINMKINVIEAKDGIECLYIVYSSLIKGRKISCIISDENMNYMKGSSSADVLSNIYKWRNLKHIPFYILTAYEDDNSLKIMLNNQAIDQIFTKPLRKNVVTGVLNSLSI